MRTTSSTDTESTGNAVGNAVQADQADARVDIMREI